MAEEEEMKLSFFEKFKREVINKLIDTDSKKEILTAKMEIVESFQEELQELSQEIVSNIERFQAEIDTGCYSTLHELLTIIESVKRTDNEVELKITKFLVAVEQFILKLNNLYVTRELKLSSNSNILKTELLNKKEEISSLEISNKKLKQMIVKYSDMLDQGTHVPANIPRSRTLYLEKLPGLVNDKQILEIEESQILNALRIDAKKKEQKDLFYLLTKDEKFLLEFKRILYNEYQKGEPKTEEPKDD